MARPKEWERIARDFNLDLQTVLKAVVRMHMKIVQKLGDSSYFKKEGELTGDLNRAAIELGKAVAINKAVQDLLENNNKSAANIEERVLKRHPRKE